MENKVNEVVDQVGLVDEAAVDLPVVTANTLPAVNADPLSNTGGFFYCSLLNDGKRSTQIKIYNALNDPAAHLSDMTEKEIKVENVLVQGIRIIDEQTGELIDTFRVVVVTPEGTAYDAVSTGIVSSIRSIMNICGAAPWSPAITIIPKTKKTRSGFKTLVLALKA